MPLQIGKQETLFQGNSLYKELEGFKHISDVVDYANAEIDAYRKGEKTPLLTFSEKLNTIIGGVYPSDQIVIAARTGVGKSAFANLLIKSLQDKNPHQNIVFLYWSLEMPNHQQVLRMYSNRFEMPVKRIMNTSNPIQESVYAQMARYGRSLKTYNLYFRDISTNTMQFETIREKAQKQFPNHQFINLFDHTRLIKRHNERTEEEKITNLMEKGVEMKNKYGDINIFISQMNRNIESAVKGDRRDIGGSAPQLSDIFGADSVSQFATLVIVLHRPDLYGKETYLPYPDAMNASVNALNNIFFHVLKQRDGAQSWFAMKHNLAINHLEDVDV